MSGAFGIREVIPRLPGFNRSAFDPDHLLFASTDLRGPAREPNSNPAQTIAVLDETLANLSAVPGIDEVAAANDKPLGGRVNSTTSVATFTP